MWTSEDRSLLESQGFCMRHDVVSAPLVDVLIRAIEEAPPAGGAGARRAAGRRNLLQIPAVRRLAASRAVHGLVESALGAGAFAVRGILFDKTAEANWSLRWHQDKAISVKERRPVLGFGPWSVKAGVAHVYPPPGVLEGMLTVRLHLDPCDATQGALQVLPGSHRHGFLDRDSLAHLVAGSEPVICAAEPGDALLMRPLLVHASGKREGPGHRRIVHLEYANTPLPEPLEWYESVGPGKDLAPVRA